MFTEVQPQRTADAVFDQVRSQIVAGTLNAGDPLPGERALSAQLNVSRGVVREALQRLAQAGLVDIRHGGSTRVLDYTTSTDLGLLQHMLIRSDSSLNLGILRSLLEMRISVGVDAARLAAKRSTPAHQQELAALVESLAAEEDVARQQAIDLEFWSTIVDAASNLAYRIAYNGLVKTYQPLQAVIATVVIPELENVESHRTMVAAIRRADTAGTEAAARALLESSKAEWDALLTSLDQDGTHSQRKG
ncbi:MAG: FadR family transcriptional regulator [Actinobacteria bacterium]|nr:FadR family transcriptional regulator [Actinomycetota bacterium]